MSPKVLPTPPPDMGDENQQDYLLDMLKQLASLARDIGETEVAIHLDATVAVRELALSRREQ